MKTDRYEINIAEGIFSKKQMCILKGVCDGILNMLLSDSFLELSLVNKGSNYECYMCVNCHYGPFYASGIDSDFEKCLMSSVGELKQTLLNWKKTRFTKNNFLAVPEVYGRISA